MKKNGFMDGAIIATCAIFITKILGIIYVIPFYKIVGEQGGALYGYAYNIYNIFLIISSAGIPLAISKITSEYVTKNELETKEKMFVIARKAINIFSFLSFAICFLFAKPIANLIIGDLTGGNSISDVTFVIRCISFALLVVPLLSISRGYLQGHKYIASSSISQVIEQVVRISVILIGSYLALNVFNLPLTIAIGISVFAAAIGAFISYIYLYIKTKKVQKRSGTLIIHTTKEENKEIIKKLVMYSLPFIIINIANSLYNTTDMILIIHGLNKMGFTSEDVELISSIFTTWAEKLGNIIKAFSSGLVISLIPSMVSAFISKNKEQTNSYFNKSLQILLYVVTPLSILMSVFSKEIWYIFYGESVYGPLIFRFTILVVILDSAYLLIGSILQSLYKTKLIYISVGLGLLINLCLDLPLMYLFNNFGLYPFYGAILSTVIGYIFSLGIPLIVLYKKDGFNYSETVKKLPTYILSLILLLICLIALKKLIIFPSNKLMCILILGFVSIISIGIYFLINRKEIINLLKIKFRKGRL